jgi:hypothetical protein
MEIVLASCCRVKPLPRGACPRTAPLGARPETEFTLGTVEKDYPTPSGVAPGARHVPQSPPGGTTDCPLDHDPRSVVSSTPRFATIVSPRDTKFRAVPIPEDGEQNPGRTVSRCLTAGGR